MTKKKLATLFLMLGMFFNPFGFDAVQILLIRLTGSYLGANLVLYCLAVFCFGLYFLFSGNCPLKKFENLFRKKINS